jgi:hypothetical protein
MPRPQTAPPPGAALPVRVEATTAGLVITLPMSEQEARRALRALRALIANLQPQPKANP